MSEWRTSLRDGRVLQIRSTDRSDGDLRIDGVPGPLAARRATIVDRPWVWVRQVHGRGVVVLDDDSDPSAVAGAEADGIVTRRSDVALAVHGADCGIVGLWSPEGVVGVAHAGWRGVRAGVLAATVDAMVGQGASQVQATLGPCIHAECYEFTGPERAELVARLGPEVAGRTPEGTPSLDLPAAILRSLAAAGAGPVTGSEACTACAADLLWSHRARGDVARQAMVVWIDEARSVPTASPERT